VLGSEIVSIVTVVIMTSVRRRRLKVAVFCSFLSSAVLRIVQITDMAYVGSFIMLFLRFFCANLRFFGTEDLHELQKWDVIVLCILLTCIQGFVSSFQLGVR
jgi:hypothetical protein